MWSQSIKRTAEKLTAHRGDPCVWCGTPHDDIEIGQCRAAPSTAMVADALTALEQASFGEPFQLEKLEAQALLEVLVAV
jgi:hypothetical protein